MAGSRRDAAKEPRTALVAPVWDRSAGPLLRSYLDAGRKPVWLSPQGFRFAEGGILTHDDWTRGDWSRLTGIVIASLSGSQDSELFEWRRSVLEEIALAGLPVVPDPRGVQLAWEPTRVLLRLRRGGLPAIDHYVGENLDDAMDFVRLWKGAQFRIPEGGHAPEIEWIAPGTSARERLEDLWQEHPTGPFVLTRDVRGEVATLLVVGAEVIGAWRGGTPGLEPEHVAEQPLEAETELALSASEAFGLDPVAVDLVRDAGPPQIHGVRPMGFWRAALDAHPGLAAALPQRLAGLRAPARAQP